MVKYKVLAKPGFDDIQTPAQGQKFIDRLRDEVFPMLDKWWAAYGMRGDRQDTGHQPAVVCPDLGNGLHSHHYGL